MESRSGRGSDLRELTLTNIVPVIISGGVGSRLWPISRALHPKP
ncbi:MAG: hypothetical protein E5X90_09315, partial [Mesorhizobium sp.]